MKRFRKFVLLCALASQFGTVMACSGRFTTQSRDAVVNGFTIFLQGETLSLLQTNFGTD